MDGIRPQPGFQEKFLSSEADIVIGGGAAGAGKSFAMLLECLRWILIAAFGAVVFRRTSPQITNQGGLWDTSMDLYQSLDVSIRPQPYVPPRAYWLFPSGARVKFSHLQHEKDAYEFQGAQIPLICFDELTHFTSLQFWYLLSRNRSMCGVKPYMRCTTNPQSKGWVKDLIQWWIYPDDYPDPTLRGYPIPERDGVVRYVTRYKKKLIWGDNRQQVLDQIPPESVADYDLDSIKSLTFIGGSLEGNLELKKKDPSYKGNLLAQDETTAMQLLKGRWYAADNDDDMFDYSALHDMFTNDFVQGGERYMTADIAMEGSNEFVIYIWDGWRATHRYSMAKSDGKIVLERLQQMATRHKVPGSNVAFDSAGMGNYLRGWLRNAIDFRGGGAAIEIDGVKMDFDNLKTQCAYHFAGKVKSYEVCVYVDSQEGQNKIVEQFDAHKKLGLNARNKLCMTGKDAVKLLLNGESPDDFDALTMRSIFDLKKRNRKRGTKAVG